MGIDHLVPDGAGQPTELVPWWKTIDDIHVDNLESRAMDKLTRIRCRLMTREPWYGTFAMEMQWRSSLGVRSIGVYATEAIGIVCRVNPKFVLAAPDDNLYATIKHCIEHVLRLHTARIGFKNPALCDIAADLAVNGHKTDPLCTCTRGGKVTTPLDGHELYVPRDWAAHQAMEEYYRVLEDMLKRSTLLPEGEMIDDHEIWQGTDMPIDELRDLVNQAAESASEKSQGDVPGHLGEILSKLKKPIVSWQSVLKSFVGNHIGGRRLSWFKQNRKRPDSFGIPGWSHRNRAQVTVIVDTSGSVSQEELQQMFAEIEMMCSNARISVVQWDASFQGFINKYRAGDWRNIEISGRGGTDMAAPVEWILEQRLDPACIIMLTDGECNWPEDPGVPMLFCLTGDSRRTNVPDFGTLLYLQEGKL